MTTREEFLFSKNKHQYFTNDASNNVDYESQYLNHNLNQNQKLPTLPVLFSSKSYNEKYYNSTVSDNYERKKKSWNKSVNVRLNIFKLNDKSEEEEVEKSWENESSDTKNNSTLSLHIDAYENSTVGFNDKKNVALKNKKINLNTHFFSDSFIQNSFEYPRQQKEDQKADPELMQFKASQRLLNPNQSNAPNNAQLSNSIIKPFSVRMSNISVQPNPVPVQIRQRQSFNNQQNSGYGFLVLVIGDFHIPQRAHNMPAKFKKLLVPNKMQHILCTGDLTSTEIVDYLRSLANDVHICRGDFDEDSSFPETKIITVGAFRIGLMHGHQLVPWGNLDSMELVARQLNVDVLVSGNTHKSQVYEKDGVFYVNPGSATGAFSTIQENVVPSFALMDVRLDTIVTYTYHLIDNEVKVDRIIFKKQA
uniref:Vacuolar protein sorting-associated protein 29 n=1 Tax=Panagrolaimus sp. PS1159 TaxID=55785 RepID=A0AC35FH21_9BILA